ncbi:Hsp20 family protein [Streptomyces mirabilis]
MLRAGTKVDEAAAEYTDGVLAVSVPVPETKTGTRTIPVHHV